MYLFSLKCVLLRMTDEDCLFSSFVLFDLMYLTAFQPLIDYSILNFDSFLKYLIIIINIYIFNFPLQSFFTHR